MHYITAFLLFFSFTAFAQNTPQVNESEKSKDTTTLRDIIIKSKLEVYSRTLFMSTINAGALKDDYALASGVGLAITTKSFHGVQAGVSSFVTYNLLSSDLTLPDPTTSMVNRYETGLFDVLNPTAKKNLIRLENLFLRYTFCKTSLTVGKMKLNTPFLNPQDGRMNATMEEGAWITSNDFKKIQINGGWMWNISPRSTTQWFSVENSFGIYPSGVQENGAKSNYHGNMNSQGVALANMVITPGKNIKINLWDMLIENVMNTAMVEVTNEFGNDLKYYQGAMFIHQDAVHDGGNYDQSKTYVTKGSQSNSISGQLGIKSKKFNSNLNYTRITNDGRYLCPREWGKDPFYTFMPREKNDGFGNVHAMTLKTTLVWLNDRLETGLGYGRYLLPDVKDYRLNKYGMPSYSQVNLNISYSWNEFLKGSTIRFLAAYKFQHGEADYSPTNVYNKVNMANMTLVFDFKI